MTTKPRHDWFQSDIDVVLTILKRGVNVEDCHATFSDENTLKVNLTDGTVLFEGVLYSTVKKEDVTVKCTPAKIEIRLPKGARGERWTSLVEDGTASAPNSILSSVPSATTGATPTFAKKNWDAIERQVVEEENNQELEGDAAVNQMFRKIYDGSDDDVRKAMMKSYSESGGTVLSTNWQEISKKKVEVQPPACMEYKEYQK